MYCESFDTSPKDAGSEKQRLRSAQHPILVRIRLLDVIAHPSKRTGLCTVAVSALLALIAIYKCDLVIQLIADLVLGYYLREVLGINLEGNPNGNVVNTNAPSDAKEDTSDAE
jgi:hypothetical protein